MYFAFTEMRTAWYLKDKDFAPRELPRPVIIRLTSGKIPSLWGSVLGNAV